LLSPALIVMSVTNETLYIDSSALTNTRNCVLPLIRSRLMVSAPAVPLMTRGPVGLMRSSSRSTRGRHARRTGGLTDSEFVRRRRQGRDGMEDSPETKDNESATAAGRGKAPERLVVS